MKIPSFNSLYPCKSFQTFSETTDLVHKVAEYLEPKDLIYYALTCRYFKNGAYHRGKELLIKAQHKCSIKWASLENTHAKKSINEKNKIDYTFAQLYSKGWLLQNFGNDLTHHGSPLFSNETANADSEFYKTHITQKECIKISGCSRQFFAHLLNLPHLKNLKGTTIYSFLSTMCKPIQSISPSIERLSLQFFNIST
jgi:hypothetical protein